MRLIPLRDRSGAVIDHACVDDADWDLVGTDRWFRSSRGYAVRHIYTGAGQRKLLMHRVVLGLGPMWLNPVHVDHINHDRLDNRRSNLRAVKPGENQQNLRPQAATSSRFRGVTWHRQCGKWQASAKVAGKNHYLGVFESEVAAAAAASEFRAARMPMSVDSLRKGVTA